MEQFVGLDVSQDFTHLCVVDSNGKTIWQGKCASTPDHIAETLRAKAPDAARIGLESGPLSTWHWHSLKDMGFPIICLDAKHAQAALKMQINKTDKNDAHGLAQVVRTGWYKTVEVKSTESHTVRAMLGVRSQLVGMRVEVTNQIRGILKNFGIVLKKRSGKEFKERVTEIACNKGMLGDTLRALLCVLDNLEEQIAALDENAVAFAKGNQACRNLMSIPGIGTLTAAAFVSSIDNPARFRKSKSVGAYFGLTPRRYQSGEVDKNTSISKCGDVLMRSYLYEAAGTILTRVVKWSSLKAWGMRLAKRAGMKKAKAAVARKLAVLMHRMWVDDTVFHWAATEPEAATV